MAAAVGHGVEGETDEATDVLLIVEEMGGLFVADCVIVDKDGGGGVRGNSFWIAFFFLPFFLAEVKGVLPSLTLLVDDTSVTALAAAVEDCVACGAESVGVASFWCPIYL